MQTPTVVQIFIPRTQYVKIYIIPTLTVLKICQIFQMLQQCQIFLISLCNPHSLSNAEFAVILMYDSRTTSSTSFSLGLIMKNSTNHLTLYKSFNTVQFI